MGQKDKIQIFIVDDDPLMSRMLSSHLCKLHYDDYEMQVASYQTGEECLKALSGNPTAIVLDYYLDSENPKAQSGLHILRKIRRYNSSVPVFMLSSQSLMPITAELLKAGANEYVVKDNSAFMRISGLVQKVINAKIIKSRKISRMWLTIVLAVILFLAYVVTG